MGVAFFHIDSQTHETLKNCSFPKYFFNMPQTVSWDYGRILGISGQKFLWSKCLIASCGQPHVNNALVEFETLNSREWGF